MRRLSRKQTQQVLKQIGIEHGKQHAYAYDDPARYVHYHFHRHTRHQLLYAFTGTIQLESSQSWWTLPPQRAAWIPAGVKHATTLGNTRCGSILFDPQKFKSPSTDIQIIPVTPLLREMILYAMQWPPQQSRRDSFATQYFSVLAQVLERHFSEEPAFRLPRAKTQAIGKAVEAVLADVGTVRLTTAAQRAALSTRTFRRRFQAEMSMSWRDFVQSAKMLKAMEWLETERNVTEVALAVGFNSMSAFSKAFRKFTQESPLAYKRRVQAASVTHAAMLPPGPSGRRGRRGRGRR